MNIYFQNGFLSMEKKKKNDRAPNSRTGNYNVQHFLRPYKTQHDNLKKCWNNIALSTVPQYQPQYKNLFEKKLSFCQSLLQWLQ